MRRALITSVAGVAALAVAAAIVVFIVKRSEVSVTVFTRAEIQAATRPSSSPDESDESKTSVQKYVTRENASGHSVRPGDVYVAVVRSEDGKTTAEFVWSGSRTPAALLVASRADESRRGVAVGLTATTPTGLPASPLPTPVDREAYGGAVADGGLRVVRSDCIDVRVSIPGATAETLSCAELWHGPQTPEWLYHHYAQGQAPLTAMSIRSRVVKDQRSYVTGPHFVSSCSDGGRTSVLAGPVKNEQGRFNPAIHMRSNPCTGYLDRINQSDWQTGAALEPMARGGASIETTGAYYVSEPNRSPAWEDYVWTYSGHGTIDESKYVARLW